MTTNADTHVFVGMSGGVDSSVAAALLIDHGYKVTGVYMKNWTDDLPGHHCPWAEDLADAKRVAVRLGIPLKVYDFTAEYKQHVVDYMLAEYQAGRTPNPDIMCNQEVKFKLFVDTAMADGADMIATGHYARVINSELHMAVDSLKDQTYFLCRMPRESLQKVIFPLGELTKPEVRSIAAERGLATAAKKESMGICFVGSVGIKDFLLAHIDTPAHGNIIDQTTKEVVGRHDGAIFYTIGQRHGLNVGGGLPYYVMGKDMDSNVVFVSRQIDSEQLWVSEPSVQDVHWLTTPLSDGDHHASVRLRHRATLVPATVTVSSGGSVSVRLHEPERAVTPGQSIVMYQGSQVVASTIVS